MPKSISKFPKVLKIWKWKMFHVFSVSLLSESLQLQKQLMIKSETHFILIHWEIINIYKEKLTQINKNVRKEKEFHLLLYHKFMFLVKDLASQRFEIGYIKTKFYQIYVLNFFEVLVVYNFFV